MTSAARAPPGRVVLTGRASERGQLLNTPRREPSRTSRTGAPGRGQHSSRPEVEVVGKSVAGARAPRHSGGYGCVGGEVLSATHCAPNWRRACARRFWLARCKDSTTAERCARAAPAFFALSSHSRSARGRRASAACAAPRPAPPAEPLSPPTTSRRPRVRARALTRRCETREPPRRLTPSGGVSRRETRFADGAGAVRRSTRDDQKVTGMSTHRPPQAPTVRGSGTAGRSPSPPVT